MRKLRYRGLARGAKRASGGGLQLPARRVTSVGMQGHIQRGLRVVGTRVPGVLFAVLAIALVTPALAMAPYASATKRARVPNCAHFPSHKMAQLIGVGSLEFQGKVYGHVNGCIWKGPSVPGQWSNLLTVEVTAKPEAEFFYAEEVAKHDATKPGYQFETTVIRGAPAFFESYVITDASKPPCQPGTTTNEFGPPSCKPEPHWFSYTAASYGALKPRGPEAFVDVNLTGEFHESKPVVIDLNRKILSGEIR